MTFDADGVHIIVPEHVVFRAFEAETVVLNLQTGKYHGLNHTAGRMLELLREHHTLAVTAGAAAEEFGTPVEQATTDLRQLCQELTERGLIELESDG